MKYLIVPFAFLLIIAFLSMMIGNPHTQTYSNTGSNFIVNGTATDYNGTLNYNGTSTDFTINVLGFDLSISATAGILAICGGLIALAAIGFRGLSTGLSETSVKIIFNVTFWGAIWLMMSGIALDGLLTFPLGTGWIFYLSLSFFYLFGIIQQINWSPD